MVVEDYTSWWNGKPCIWWRYERFCVELYLPWRGFGGGLKRRLMLMFHWRRCLWGSPSGRMPVLIVRVIPYRV